MRMLSLFVFAISMSVGLAAPVPKNKEKSNAEKVLGTWKLVGGTQGKPANDTRLHLTFMANGKVLLKQNVGIPNEYAREGTYKVEGDKIHYKVTTPGYEKEETLTLKKITETQMEFVDPDDIQEDFVRIPDVKK